MVCGLAVLTALLVKSDEVAVVVEVLDDRLPKPGDIPANILLLPAAHTHTKKK